nr:MAG TPA: hypothetical protein [Caudoviricetes sp.]
MGGGVSGIVLFFPMVRPALHKLPTSMKFSNSIKRNTFPLHFLYWLS